MRKHARVADLVHALPALCLQRPRHAVPGAQRMRSLQTEGKAWASTEMAEKETMAFVENFKKKNNLHHAGVSAGTETGSRGRRSTIDRKKAGLRDEWKVKHSKSDK
jgi:hypothetical protein